MNRSFMGHVLCNWLSLSTKPLKLVHVVINISSFSLKANPFNFLKFEIFRFIGSYKVVLSVSFTL